jgi:acetoin utilization deacetylase AcuC-like enzyme
MRIAWSPAFAHPLPTGHRFPMQKYALLPEQLIREGICDSADFFVPAVITENDLLTAHSPAYIQKLKTLSLTPREQRATGFPLSEALVIREGIIMQGTIDCARFALRQGVSLNIAGGTHHAYRDRGEGFCLYNDFAIAALVLLREGLINKALIVDLDVHQGNGSASILSDESRVFTFSMHAGANYPLRKEQSDLDVELPVGADDALYLALLKKHLPEILEQVKPDIVLYQSGVDVLKCDKLGKLALSTYGCALRDRYVMQESSHRGIPLAAAMGGGYSERLSDILNAHCETFRAAKHYYV